MKEINIKINDMDNLVKVQRYFASEDGSYLIYSQDESDVDGNVKIYVVKVVDNNQVVPINTPEEWDRVKKTIVGIINDNKEFTKLDVQDLDSKVLNNLEITDVRALRLPNAVMQYLSANQPEFSTIDLSENEKVLEEKTENLKNMNVELNTMINDVQTPVVEKEEVSKDNIVENTLENVESENEEKMSATMEIIMPTKQTIHENNEEQPKKKKGKFNFKSLFGIKDEEEVKEEIVPEPNEIVTEPVIPVTESVQNTEETTNAKEITTTPVEPIVSESQGSEKMIEESDNLENKIVDKAELPDPTPLNPIVVENNVDSASTVDIQPINIEPIIPEPVIPVTEPVQNNDEITNDNSGFDFFDNLPKPSVSTNVENVINQPGEPVSQMEVLTLEEDLKYKKLYEENEDKIKELENKIFEMEKAIEIYEAKLKEIKNITQ